MFDKRINRDAVLTFIYDKKNSRYTIWSPCRTLSLMGIEYYPHVPSDNRLRMKAVLKNLCDDGLIVQRKAVQKTFTFRETAYNRIAKITPESSILLPYIEGDTFF